MSIFSRFTSDDSTVSNNEVGGLDSVHAALSGRLQEDYTPPITFGEPRLVDRAAGPVNDLYVVLPTFTAVGEADPANVEFDLPEDPEDESEELNRFLNDIDADSIDDVEGMSVPSKRVDGVLTVERISDDY